MNDDAPSASPPRRRRWGRWVRRAMIALVAVVALLAVFHRPLAHWALRHFGIRFAEKAGLQAEWKSSGSVVGDLVFDDLRVIGVDHSVLRSLTVEHAALEYDLRRLWSGGVGAVVDTIVLRRVEADIDLTRGVGKADTIPKKSGHPGKGLPSVRVPSIEIDHLSLRVRQRNGVVEVVDFSLTLDPKRPGIISVARFSAPGMPDLSNAAGTTRATADSLTVENLSLWPETRLEHLVVQLADLTAGRLRLDGAARQGGASVAAQGMVGFEDTAGPVVEAEAKARGVTNGTLAFWGVPDGGLVWNSGEVALRAVGPVLRPDQLVAELTVEKATVARDGLPEATLGAAAKLKNGAFTLAESQVTAGRALAVVRGTAVMPATWAGVGAATAQGTVDFEVAALDAVLPKQTGVRGRASGRAEVSVAQRALASASATIDGAEIVVQGLPVEHVSARVTTTDGGRVQLKAGATLNAANALDAEGWLDVRGDQAFEATWKADCRDLATVPVEVRAGLPWPTAGTVLSSGSVAGFLAAVRSRDWTRLTGAADVQASGIKVKDAALESLRLRAQSNGGEVRVDDLVVRFDAENAVTGTGQAVVADGVAPVSAQLHAALPSVARLSGWSTAFGGPALRGGSATIDWEARRDDGLTGVTGTGSALVRGLRIDGVPETLGLEAAVAHSGRSISISRLAATAGAWRAEGSATWDGARVVVPAGTAWMNNQRVAAVQATLPIDGRRGPGPGGAMALDEPVDLAVTVEALDLDRLGAGLGKALPVRGVVKAEAQLSGTLRTLRGTMTADVSRVRPAGKDIDGLEPAGISMKAALTGGRLTLEARAQQKPLEPFTLEVRAPVDAATLMSNPSAFRDIPLTGRLRLVESSLAFVPGWLPAVSSVRGTAALDATIGGTVGRPQWQATGTVIVPEARLAGATLTSIRDMTVRIRADEKRITVQEAGVMLAGGRLRVQGGADLARLDDPVLDLRLRAEEALVVRDENLSLRANADIICRGPVSRAAVSGSIDLVRGRVFKEIEFLPLSLPNQLPPPPPPTTLASTGPPALPPPLDAWTINLAIKTRDPIRLMGNVARGNVVTDLRLSGTGARPVLTGRATMEQMWLRLPFSRLTITEGAIVFTEEKPFDPQISIHGESFIDGRIVEVAVQGRALDPTVRLNSSPPLPEGEIATLLATGVTTSDLTTRGDEAVGRAAFVVLQQAYRRMFRKTARSSDDAEPPRLSIQFSFFGSDPTRRNLSAIYELNPKWRVIGRVGEAGTFRGMLHYLIRFR